MGSDESLLNFSLIVSDKIRRQRPQTTTVEEKGEPKRIRTEVRTEVPLLSYQPDALPLGHSGSHRPFSEHALNLLYPRATDFLWRAMRHQKCAGLQSRVIASLVSDSPVTLTGHDVSRKSTGHGQNSIIIHSTPIRIGTYRCGRVVELKL